MFHVNIILIISAITIVPAITLGQILEGKFQDSLVRGISAKPQNLSDTIEKLKFKNLLQEVIITSKLNARQDSLNRRKLFAKEFNYKGTTLYNAFSLHKPSGNSGDLISVNPLTLIAIFTRKKNKQSKLQQTLIKDEHSEYVDRKFNKALVANITKLKEDSLSAFISAYRPSYQFCQTASKYDVITYIRQKLQVFRADNNVMTAFKNNPFK